METIIQFEQDGEEYYYSPEDYAAMWGCDSWGDKPPNHVGDGALFYNFGSENQERTPAYLQQFIEAIDRQILGVKTELENKPQDPKKSHGWTERDTECLDILRQHVQDLLEESQHAHA